MMRYLRTPIHPVLLALAACSLLVAACGSSNGSPGSGGPSARAQTLGAAVRFADCMRSNGVPDFPDPTTSPRDFKQALNPNTARSPVFLSAAMTCQHLLPTVNQPNRSPAQTQARTAGLLAFARCIRSHGFPSFPDPSSGQITHEMLAQAGIDLHQPAVVPTADACVGVTHGIITKATVARFVAGQ
jgi:hypothetical protein